jgi:hypothetical protein
MSWIGGGWAKFVGLFIDDGILVVAVLVWLAACWLILPRLALPSGLPPMLLFIGLVLILAESVFRRARWRS